MARTKVTPYHYVDQFEQTDNSALDEKVALRLEYLPDNPVVLDCFAGNGVIWKRISEITKKEIPTLRIDMKATAKGFHLVGDNLMYLNQLDLSKFNVVDLDAYGSPMPQLKLLFDRGYHGTVFITFIQSGMRVLPHALLLDIGFTRQMIQKCPTLYGRRGYQYLLEWLADRGVTKAAVKTVNSTGSLKRYIAITL